MKINWKEVSKSKGYISCKQGMIQCRKQSFSNKESLYKKFQWILGKAKHYSHILNIPIEEVLNIWEEERNYSWENFYQNHEIKRICKLITRRENS